MFGVWLVVVGGLSCCAGVIGGYFLAHRANAQQNIGDFQSPPREPHRPPPRVPDLSPSGPPVEPVQEAEETGKILDAIRHILRLMRHNSQLTGQSLGVNGPQLLVLEKLAEADVPLSVNAIADRTHTHQSSVSVLLQALVDKGLVVREQSAADRRRLDVSLTPAARDLPGSRPRHL